MIGIYKVTNKINNKSYIGQSKNIEQRWHTHKISPYNKNSTQYNTLFYKAIRKYGINNFSFEVLEECSIENLNEREIYWIAYYDTYNKNKGYNMTKGGECGVSKKYDEKQMIKKWKQGASFSTLKKEFHCSKQTITNYLQNNNISVKERRTRANLYKAIAVIQYSLDGKYIKTYPSLSAASEAVGIVPKIGSGNISYACKGRISSAYNYLWKYANDLTPVEELVCKAKMKLHHRNQKVNQYNLNGDFIKTFNTISEAAKSVGLKSISGITNACVGLSKTSKGYIWKYANE